MNKIGSILFCVFLFLCLSCKKQESNKNEKLLIFNGIWYDVIASDDFKNCSVVYSKVVDSIYMGHYLEFKGRAFYEIGSGIIKGDSIIYHVDVIRPIPEWGPAGGTHYLKLSEDGNTLKGIFITDTGNKGPLVFKRTK